MVGFGSNHSKAVAKHSTYWIGFRRSPSNSGNCSDGLANLETSSGSDGLANRTVPSAYYVRELATLEQHSSLATGLLSPASGLANQIVVVIRGQSTLHHLLQPSPWESDRCGFAGQLVQPPSSLVPDRCGLEGTPFLFLQPSALGKRIDAAMLGTFSSKKKNRPSTLSRSRMWAFVGPTKTITKKPKKELELPWAGRNGKKNL